ncbi:MAG: ISAs1 family transposase [Actinobacteria bacterium]|nr:ISAs1 family transposase [Actinomycetota bacterium]
MPAASASPIRPVLDHLIDAVDHQRVGSGVLAVLDAVPDPRKPRGIRHQINTILALAVCAVMAGCRSFTAIGEWAADASEQVLCALGAGYAPSESTMRRTLQRLDGDELDSAIGSWAAGRTEPASTRRRVVAVDGKRIRGSGHGTEAARHLLAAIDHAHAVVLAQREVGCKTNEITEFAPLLNGVELTGAVVTADALHAQKAHADYLVLQRGAHYLLTVKGNQPGLFAQLKALPWKQVPLAHTSTDRAHGRVEKRAIKMVTVTTGILFPHARQAIQITRKTRRLDGTTWTTEVAYAVTSLAAEHATASQLASWVRGHWHIENRLHWVRDVTFDEDRSHIRCGSGPRVMASLRNLVISILRINGTTNIAQALRHHAWNPHRPITILTTC